MTAVAGTNIDTSERYVWMWAADADRVALILEWHRYDDSEPDQLYADVPDDRGGSGNSFVDADIDRKRGIPRLIAEHHLGRPGTKRELIALRKLTSRGVFSMRIDDVVKSLGPAAREAQTTPEFPEETPVTETLEAPPYINAAEVPIGHIVPAPDNIRRNAEPSKSLIASIKSHGLIEPLVARTVEQGEDGEPTYELVAGERRWRGALAAKLPTVPVIIRDDLDERGRLECMLIENGEREDLKPIELAEAYERLKKLGAKQQEIVDSTGTSPAHVSKHLALLKLPDTARKAIDAGALTVTDGYELSKIADDPNMLDKAWSNAANDGMPIAAAVKLEQDRRDRNKRKAEAEAALEAENVAVIAHPGGIGDWKRRPERPLAGQRVHDWPLLNDTLTFEQHGTDHPECHGAAVNGLGETVWVCLAPDRHLEAETDGPSAGDSQVDAGESIGVQQLSEDDLVDEAEVARRERAAALSAAAAARRDAICRIVRGEPRKPDKTVVLNYLLTRAVFAEECDVVYPTDIALALGVDIPLEEDEWDWVNAHALESGDQLVAVGLARALIQTELEITKFHTWADDQLVERHFDFLAGHGYEISDVERDELGTALHEEPSTTDTEGDSA